MIVLVLITFVLIFLGGGLANDVFDAIGLGDTAALVWKIARWPLALLTAMVIYAVVYYAGPNVEVPHFRWITPGAVVGRARRGSSPRPASSSTSRTSPPTAPPTAPSPPS